MKNEKLRVTATGDSLFVAPFPDNYNQEYKEVADYINECDVKITNLETNLSDFEYPANAYSGGTWINTRRNYFRYLQGFGFNFYGNANNHAMDYGHDGLLSTIRYLDEQNLAHAGTGEDFAEAEKPAVITVKNKRIAIFAVDTSFEKASIAGKATKNIKGRAGVNYLRHTESFYVTPEQMDNLKDIAKTTNLNFCRELNIKTGYALPDKDGVFVFGGKTFTLDKNEPSSRCNSIDLKRITESIRKATTDCDYVFMQVHCHDDDNKSHSNPPEYLVEFCHSCIDAGVSAVFGGGCHSMRPIEIYKNKPIFYSLGDFIYQGLRVEYLPADFMESYGADINLTAKEALLVRSRGNKVGLHLNKKNYLTVLPMIEFSGKEMVSFSIIPVELNFEARDFRNGLPKIANGETEKEIIDIVNSLSKPYGTQFEFVNGVYKAVIK